ncbi:hypothetical protein PR048_033441 [Dryococelus australis]|uniref:Uncharacterized protein n=1 Tax=Dryococelus australis TaxID=614101 RepID=A0ABQ9G3L4_9NEOP|nr:hypothetical protein PR048_033441 [Dryococelus australis]
MQRVSGVFHVAAALLCIGVASPIKLREYSHSKGSRLAGGTRSLGALRNKIDVQHVYCGVTFTFGSQIIRHALDKSEPIADVRKQVASVILPASYISACAHNDPDLPACVKKNALAAIPEIMKGDRKYHVPPLDPFFISEMKVEQQSRPGSSGYSFALTNATITGLSKVVVQDIRGDFDAKKLELVLTFPHLELMTTYKLSGNFRGLPITGDGPGNITLSTEAFLARDDAPRCGLLEFYFFRKSHVDKDPAPKEIGDIEVRDIICWKTFPVHEGKADNTAVITDLNVDCYFDFDEKKDNGLTYLIPNDPKIKFDIGGRMYLQLDNLLNGDKAIGENVNAVLNDNWRDVAKAVGPGVADMVGALLKQTLSGMLELVPVEEIFV